MFLPARLDFNTFQKLVAWVGGISGSGRCQICRWGVHTRIMGAPCNVTNQLPWLEVQEVLFHATLTQPPGFVSSIFVERSAGQAR